MKQIEANIREEIKQCQYNVCCMTLAVKEYRKRDNIYNWAVALSSFGIIAGHKLIMPIEHTPNRDYLAYHRDRIFKGL